MRKHVSFGRGGTFAAIAALFTASLTVLPAHAVTEPQPAAVPRSVRWDPRAAGVVGEGPAGLVYLREADPTSPTIRGAAERVLRATDGNQTVLTGGAEQVYGSRLVEGVIGSTIRSRVLPDGAWESVTIPTGQRFAGSTAAGVVVAHGPSGANTVSLLPWDGGAAVGIAGVPSGRNITTNTGPFADARGVIVQTSSSDGAVEESVYVDTATLRAWPLGLSSGEWGINEDTLAWSTTGSNGGRLLGTMPRPSAAQPRPARDTRPAPELGFDLRYLSLLPVGEDVVVWRQGPIEWYQYSLATDAPVYAVAPDGAGRRLLTWGHDIRPAASGQILAVGADDPKQPAIRRLDVATGSSSLVAPLAPVPSWTTQVAVDDKVSYVDNREQNGALSERTVTGGGTTSLGTEQRVASPAATVSCPGSSTELRCSYLVAGDGSLAWVETFGTAGRRWVVRTADGTVRRGDFPSHVNAKALVAVSGPWLLFDNGYLLDTRSTVQTPLLNNTAADLYDGVAYRPGTVMETGPRDSILMRSLDSGRVGTLPVAGCLELYTVRAAGSWLLVSCTTEAEPKGTSVVIDRTGQTPQWKLQAGGELRLGNGFLVRRDAEDNLSWTPLAVSAPEWHSLGTVSTRDGSWAVGRGTLPNVGWIDPDGQAHVVQLPVATSPEPPHPTTELSPPSTLEITAEQRDRAITLTWARPAASEQVRGYVVRGGADRFQTVLGSDATSATFKGLGNGNKYTFWVTAQNIAGETTTTTTAVPLGPPPAAQDVEVTVDKVHSTAKVTWTWTPKPASEQVVSFDVLAGSGERVGLPASARSATVTVPLPYSGPVSVVANGKYGSWSADSAPVSFPGVDSTAPKVAVPDVPRALLTGSVGVPLKASDNRSVRSLDLRWRSAGSGKPLGVWEYPAAWQRRGTGRVEVTGLTRGQTYCFSARARDLAGNVSRWTKPGCTTVALDDRTLTRSGAWKLTTGARFYQGTGSASGSQLATLTRKGVRADGAWLVATTCPTCGSVRVQVGYDEWGIVKLRSDVRRDRRIIALPWPMRLTGKLILRPVARSGRVTIDGIALRSY